MNFTFYVKIEQINHLKNLFDVVVSRLFVILFCD